MTIRTKEMPESLRMSRDEAGSDRMMPALSQNSYVATPARKIFAVPRVRENHTDKNGPEDILDVG